MAERQTVCVQVLWGEALMQVEEGLNAGRRWLWDEASRKVGMLLAAPAAFQGEHFLQASPVPRSSITWFGTCFLEVPRRPKVEMLLVHRGGFKSSTAIHFRCEDLCAILEPAESVLASSHCQIDYHYYSHTVVTLGRHLKLSHLWAVFCYAAATTSPLL